MIVLALLTSLAAAAPPTEPVDPAPATEPAPAVEVAPDTELNSDVTVPAPPVFEMDEDTKVPAANNDAFGMGGRVELDGPVGDNAYIMGGDVVIGETVHGDLLVMGGSVRVQAPIDGDVYALGGEVEFTPDAHIGGHLTTAGGQVEMNGSVGGDVSVGAGQFILGGHVSGDVSADAGELVIADGASISGDLEYTTGAPTDDVDKAVGGAVSWTQSTTEGPSHSSPGTSVIGGIFAWTLWSAWSYLSKLVAGVVLLMLFGAAATRVSRTIVDKPAESLGYGIAGFLFLPMASILAMLLIIPLPLGMMGMATFFVLTYVCQLFAAQAMGDMLLHRFRPGTASGPALALALGLLPLVLFTSLPWVGTLFWFVATVMGGGALWIQARSKTSSVTAA